MEEKELRDMHKEFKVYISLYQHSKKVYAGFVKKKLHEVVDVYLYARGKADKLAGSDKESLSYWVARKDALKCILSGLSREETVEILKYLGRKYLRVNDEKSISCKQIKSSIEELVNVNQRIKRGLDGTIKQT